MSHDARHALTFAKEASRRMPGSIKQVADLLLAEGTGIADLTMAQIAAQAYTSKPTLVRFAKLAGYKGWRDYRSDFLQAMELVEEERRDRERVDINFPFDPHANTRDIMDAITRIHKLAAKEVARSLDDDTLFGAARGLLSAQTIVAVGAMQNYNRNKVFASNLSLIGMLCHVPTPEETPAFLEHLNEGDCVVVTSYSGGLNHMPFALLPRARQRGATLVAITNSARSPLATVADFTLGFAPLERYHAKVSSFYSGSCTTLMLEALFAACYSQCFDESKERVSDLVNTLAPLMSGDFGRLE